MLVTCGYYGPAGSTKRMLIDVRIGSKITCIYMVCWRTAITYKSMVLYLGLNLSAVDFIVVLPRDSTSMVYI
jgi:hypothetical protein